MKLKQGVIMAGLQLPMRRALLVVEPYMNEAEVDLVITAALDGEHSAGSLHYYGYAIDIRTRDLPSSVDKGELVAQISFDLGMDYDVILHDTHIHIEYDVIVRNR